MLIAEIGTGESGYKVGILLLLMFNLIKIYILKVKHPLDDLLLILVGIFLFFAAAFYKGMSLRRADQKAKLKVEKDKKEKLAAEKAQLLDRYEKFQQEQARIKEQVKWDSLDALEKDRLNEQYFTEIAKKRKREETRPVLVFLSIILILVLYVLYMTS